MTELDPEPWTNQVPWFLAQLNSPQPMNYGFVLDAAQGTRTHARLTAPDGSWCTVALDTGVVRQAGPRRLWDAVEAAHAQWIAADRPEWNRLGLTVRRDRQWVWVDDPTSPITWSVPGVEGGWAASTQGR